MWKRDLTFFGACSYYLSRNGNKVGSREAALILTLPLSMLYINSHLLINLY